MSDATSINPVRSERLSAVATGDLDALRASNAARLAIQEEPQSRGLESVLQEILKRYAPSPL